MNKIIAISFIMLQITASFAVAGQWRNYDDQNMSTVYVEQPHYKEERNRLPDMYITNKSSNSDFTVRY